MRSIDRGDPDFCTWVGEDDHSAKLRGRGHFIYKDDRNLEGFAAIECEFEEPAPTGDLYWTATYFISKFRRANQWNGFWFLFDRSQMQVCNFCELKFDILARSPGWFSRLVARWRKKPASS